MTIVRNNDVRTYRPTSHVHVHECVCIPLASTGASLGPNDLNWLYKFLKSAAPSWRMIGEALNFKFEELHAIARMPGLHVEDDNYFQELLHSWMKRTPDRTTKEILAVALASAGEERLAYELRNGGQRSSDPTRMATEQATAVTG